MDSPYTTLGADETPAIDIEHLRKKFRREDKSELYAIDDVSLQVMPGEFVVLLGPSGCGKTTLLRSVAGLETPDSGSIRIGGTTRFDADHGTFHPPEKRGISMIFQSYALWPHMTAFKNIAYAVQNERPRPSRAEITKRVGDVLAQVGIPELAGQYPGQMSGGQQQRVALARSLVKNDSVILFDEPLSNVDAKVREQLRVELLAMQRRIGFSALFVTHDQTEAMELATRIAVIDAGRIAQFGTPEEIYARPATPYVARFIGAINEIEGRVVRANGREAIVDTQHGQVSSTNLAGELRAGDAVVATWRPERGHLSLHEPIPTANTWQFEVAATMFVGSHTEYLLRAGDMKARLWSPRHEAVESGTRVWVSVSPDDMRVLPIDEQGPAAKSDDR
jgi:iron(III) transport system ATP-binding protein